MDFWAVWDAYMLACPADAWAALTLAPVPGRCLGEQVEYRVSRHGVADCLLWAMRTGQVSPQEALDLAMSHME
jgi:hypothetical protein